MLLPGRSNYARDIYLRKLFAANPIVLLVLDTVAQGTYQTTPHPTPRQVLSDLHATHVHDCATLLGNSTDCLL
jgi:hypothetical protein